MENQTKGKDGTRKKRKKKRGSEVVEEEEEGSSSSSHQPPNSCSHEQSIGYSCNNLTAGYYFFQYEGPLIAVKSCPVHDGWCGPCACLVLDLGLGFGFARL